MGRRHFQAADEVRRGVPEQTASRQVHHKALPPKQSVAGTAHAAQHTSTHKQASKQTHKQASRAPHDTTQPNSLNRSPLIPTHAALGTTPMNRGVCCLRFPLRLSCEPPAHVCPPVSVCPLRLLCVFRAVSVYTDGAICLDILANQWSPIYDVAAILSSIQSLLTDPNPNSPANVEAAKLYVENRREYDRKVTETIEGLWKLEEQSEDEGKDDDDDEAEAEAEDPDDAPRKKQKISEIAAKNSNAPDAAASSSTSSSSAAATPSAAAPAPVAAAAPPAASSSSSSSSAAAALAVAASSSSHSQPAAGQ